MKVDKKSFEIEEKSVSEYMLDYIKLMCEGKSIKDSFAVFAYFLETPLRVIKREFGFYSKPSLIYNVTIKNRDGEFFCGNSWLMTQGAISDYEPASREYFNLSKGVFIDVGANIGKYSVMVGKQLKSIGQVISIEASEEIFEILKKNIEINNLKNVTPINLAVSDIKGTAEFYLASKDLGTAHSLLEIKHQSKKIEVKQNTLDNIINDLKIKKVDLIKIDVEGVEPNVLKGAYNILKRDKPKIIFESLDKKCFEKCEKILKKIGYKIKRLGPIDFVAEVWR